MVLGVPIWWKWQLRPVHGGCRRKRGFLHLLNLICLLTVSPRREMADQETTPERQRWKYWPDSSLEPMTCVFAEGKECKSVSNVLSDPVSWQTERCRLWWRMNQLTSNTAPAPFYDHLTFGGSISGCDHNNMPELFQPLNRANLASFEKTNNSTSACDTPLIWPRWWDRSLLKNVRHTHCWSATSEQGHQAIRCYATAGSPIKVQRVARWSWATHHDAPNTRERRCLHSRDRKQWGSAC